MKTLCRTGVVFVVVAAFFAQQSSAAAAKSQGPATKIQTQTQSTAPASPSATAPRLHVGKAGGFFPAKKSGRKDIGICTISCADGSGDQRIAFDVQDCACQCASVCGGSCDALDLDTLETASC